MSGMSMGYLTGPSLTQHGLVKDVLVLCHSSPAEAMPASTKPAESMPDRSAVGSHWIVRTFGEAAKTCTTLQTLQQIM
jgi:hypothetical protein